MRIRDRNYPGDYHGVLDYLGTVRIVDGYDTHDPIAAAIDYDHDDDNDECTTCRAIHVRRNGFGLWVSPRPIPSSIMHSAASPAHRLGILPTISHR